MPSGVKVKRSKTSGRKTRAGYNQTVVRTDDRQRHGSECKCFGPETEDEMHPALHLYITFRQAGWNYVSRESILTPWSTDFLEKQTGSQLVKKFPAFYGTQRSITALIRAATCPYSEPDQSVQAPHPTF